MSRRIILPRRTFLRGMGGVSLALPLMSSWGCTPEEQRRIEKVGSAQQRAGEFPKRFIFIYTPNGNYEPPTADFGGYWSTLLPLKNKINIIKGLDLSVSDLPPGEPHQQGMAILTGRGLNTGQMVGGDGSLAGWASGISLDQEIAKVAGVMTKRATLNLGVQSTNYGGTEVRTVLSYLDSDVPVPNETSPWAVFDALFSDLGSDPVGSEKLTARRKSVLDLVDKKFATLSQKVSANDKKKLEQHLDAVREVEMRLDNPGGVIGGFCQMPEVGAQPESIDAYLGDPNNFAEIGRLQMDLLSMAFACDLTRVATLQWSASTNNRPYPWLTYNGQPILDDEHGLGHQPDLAVDAWGKLAVIRTWYLEQLMYLLNKLDSIEEGEGTMLDNTVVVLSSEITRGNTHSHKDQFFILAGGCGNYLKTGQFIEYTGDRPHNDLLVTLMNAMGIEGTAFGDPAYCTGALPELTV
ncbi:MAG: DUF1552 domain-containing protein [Polyangiaceae bacterium]|nr:DUF1552 domain-containing protein [Polyangiaceae bacterium]